MSRTYKVILGMIVLVLMLFIYAQASQPKALDWTPTYSRNDKIPMGTYVFFHSLKNRVQKIEKVDESPFKFLQDSSVQGTYLFIGQGIGFNKSATSKLLEWVKKGNNLFVSSNYMSQIFLDTLNVKTRGKVLKTSLINYPRYNFTNSHMNSDSAYIFRHNTALYFFDEIDTTKQIVLGDATLKTDSKRLQKEEINFIEAPLGKGKIFLHSSPQVFSNFFMLDHQNYQYVEKLLAYLDLDQTVYYDIYHDPTKSFHTSPLYILLHNRYLKWAYYFVIIAVILFVIFEGKRKQKAIKVVEPPRNMTYDYTRTIAGMYLDQKDHSSIAHKKITQFLNFIRNELRTDFEKVDPQLINRLQELTSNSKEEIKELFEEIQRLQRTKFVTKKDLLSLHHHINNFKKNL